MSADKPNSEFKNQCVFFTVFICGLEIQTGGKNGRVLLTIKGNKETPSSE